jgi:hypothetical protein
MTRGEIKRRIRLLGKHYFSGDNDLDPFGLDLLIVEVTNQIARTTDSYIGRRYLDIVAGTSEYCDSDLYRVKNIFTLQSDGDYERLQLIDWADARSQDYRRTDTDITPTQAIVFGMNRIKLYPQPSASTTNGLMIEGYAIPGDYWVYDSNGNPVTLIDSHSCPLPESGHDAVVYGVLAEKALQMRDGEAAQIYTQKYQERVGILESNAAVYSRRTL